MFTISKVLCLVLLLGGATEGRAVMGSYLPGEGYHCEHFGGYGALKVALAQIHQAAIQGNTLAQYRLGIINIRGEAGVTANGQTAAYWLGMAAERGMALAQHDLAIMHARGLGIPVNWLIAGPLLEKAALNGHAGAQHEVGVWYARGFTTGGLVVTQNRERGLWFLKTAASRGHLGAQRDLAILFGQ